METAPGGLLDDLDLMRRWMPFEVFSVVGETRELLRFDGVQGVGEGHVAEAVMMAVAFAIGGDMDELRPLTVLVEGADEPIDQVFTAGQQAFESDAAGNRAIVKEQRDGPAGGQTLLIRLGWIYLSAAYVAPGASGDAPNASGLVGRKDRETNPELRQDFQCLEIHRGFRQPHALGRALEAPLKVAHTP